MPRYIREIPYWAKSLLFFVTFQLIIFPLMIVSYTTGLIPIYRFGAIQSIALTSFVNYLLYDHLQPSSIYRWYLVGLPFYAITGLIIGWGLRNRFVKLNEWHKLIASLILFEIVLHTIIWGVQAAGFWNINTGW